MLKKNRQIDVIGSSSSPYPSVEKIATQKQLRRFNVMPTIKKRWHEDEQFWSDMWLTYWELRTGKQDIRRVTTHPIPGLGIRPGVDKLPKIKVEQLIDQKIFEYDAMKFADHVAERMKADREASAKQSFYHAAGAIIGAMVISGVIGIVWLYTSGFWG